MFSVLIQSQDKLNLEPFKAIKTSTQFIQDWRIGELKMKIIADYESEHSTQGVLRLYRTSIQECTAQSAFVLLCLAVPNHIYPQDFLKLLGHDSPHVLIIQDTISSRYMILLQFSTREQQDSFYATFNGKRFNSFDTEVCQLVYIDRIFVEEGLSVLHTTCNDSPSSSTANEHTTLSPSKTTLHEINPTISNEHTLHKSNEHIQFPSALIELPTCPVCLDRMDSTTTGLFTTLCQHTFHCHCIMRWGDTTCPVCRYSLIETSTNQQCQECHSDSLLWICVVCGYIGCGRFLNQHAYSHFIESGHPFALEMETQRVWDYAEDRYVHRVIRHKDGNLVTVSTPEKVDSDFLSSEKIEIMTDQIRNDVSLRMKTEYEGVLDHMEQKSIDYVSLLQSQMNELDLERIRVLKDRDLLRDQFRQEKSVNEKQALKIQKLVAKMEELEKSRKEEVIMSQSLLENYNTLKKEYEEQRVLLKSRDEDVKELKEQVRDLMFFIETLEKSKNDKDLQEASVVGTSTSASLRATTKSPRKKKK